MRILGGALAAVVVVAAIGILIIRLLSVFTAQPHPMQPTAATAAGVKRVSLTLQTFPFSPYEDPQWLKTHVNNGHEIGILIPPRGANQDWVTYWPTTNLVVPAHAVVTMTIQNYDTATPLINPFYGTVQGTIGNTMTVDGKTETQANPDDVSHTFTIHAIPQAVATWLFVSVPLTAVSDSAPTDAAGMPNTPVVTQFSFTTGQPGHYIWQCFDPCGSNFNGFGGPMQARGFMTGTFTVV